MGVLPQVCTVDGTLATHVPRLSPNAGACCSVGYLLVVYTSWQSSDAAVTGFKSSHDGSSESSRDITRVSSSIQPEASDDAASDLSDDASMTASKEV